MRRVSTFVATVVALGLSLSVLPVGAATARQVDPRLFGQHIAGIAGGAPTTLTQVGSIRLWDSAVAWRNIQPNEGAPQFAALDAAISNIETKYPNAEIMYTLGSPPQWAAVTKTSKYALYGDGSNSHPDENAYMAYLIALIDRYDGNKGHGRIDAFQIWNEANLRDFYLGSPAQMASLTVKAGKVIQAADRISVAPSVTIRAAGPVGKFGKAYGAAMRKAGAWKHVNAVSAHFYPPATKGPAERVKYIKKTKKYFKKYGAGKKPLWDTEMNYGDQRAYMKVKRLYTGEKARTYAARTYIDSVRYGVARVHWYGWDINVLGTDMTRSGALQDGGRAFLAIQDWMSGRSWYGCKSKASITTCKLSGNASIRYAAKKKTLTMPTGSWQIRRLSDVPGSVPPVVTKGAKVPLTAEPILITRVG